MSRIFILKATQAPTSSEKIKLDDLKLAGRLDLVCRCVSNALFISNYIRPDTVIHVVLEGKPKSTRVISFVGGEIKKIEYDERSIAMVIKKALKKGTHLNKGEEIEVFKGIKISRKTFTKFVSEFSDKNIYYLHKRGIDIRKIKFIPSMDNVFVFGDHKGIDKQTGRFLKRINAKKISLSPLMIYSSHCIVIVHNELDVRKL